MQPLTIFLGQLVDKTGLSGTDRILGACFGLLRGVLVVALFFVDTFTNFNQSEWWKSSKLIPHFGFILWSGFSAVTS